MRTILGAEDRAALFAYEKGTTMAGDFKAPGRRVAFFASETLWPILNEKGLRLFDAAVDWAASNDK